MPYRPTAVVVAVLPRMSAQIVVVSVLTEPASTRIASAESALLSVTELLLIVALIRLVPSRAITSMPRLATPLMVFAVDQRSHRRAAVAGDPDARDPWSSCCW